MRKTRLVILPGVRSLNKIGCLLLFLACPTIAFKGQENREVEPLCKAEDLKEFWEQESPWPGDIGGLGARNNDLGSRPRLEKLTQHTCNVDGELEAQLKFRIESRIAAQRRENTRRLDSSVNSRFRSRDNLLGRRRLVQSRNERGTEARAETNQSPNERRQLEESRTSTYRANTGIVNNRERIHRENGSRRDLNRMDRSAEIQSRSEDREAGEGTDNIRRGLSLNRRTRSLENVRNDVRMRSDLHDREVRAVGGRSEHRVEIRRSTRREVEVRDSRSESRIETRVDNDNIRRGLSLDRRTRSTENMRSNMQVRSVQQIREIRGIHRRSELREDGRSTRREGEVTGARNEINAEKRILDARRIEKGTTRGTAQPQEVIRTVRERMDGRERRMSRTRMNQNVRDNQRDIRTVDNRRNLGEVRIDRDDTRGSLFPANLVATRHTRSVEDLSRTDRRARGASRDMDANRADRRRSEDRRRETMSVEREMERMDRGREDMRRRQIDRRNVRALEGVDRLDRRARIINAENRLQARSTERDVLERDSTSTDNRNTREDIRKYSIRVRDSRSPRSTRLVGEIRQLHRSARMASDDNRFRQVESRRLGEIRRETRSIEMMVNSIQNTNDISRENDDIRDSRFLTRNSRSVQDVRRFDIRDQSVSRRGIEIRRERMTMRRDVNRIDENSVESRRMDNNVRDSRLPVSLQPLVTRMESRNIIRVTSETNILDGRSSVARDERESRRLTKRQVAGFSRLVELTRHIGWERRGDGESQRGTRSIRRGMSPDEVELATGSSRIRSNAGRSHLTGDVRFSEREERDTLRRVENMRGGMYIIRDTRNLKLLKSGKGPDFRTERNSGRPNTMRFYNDERSVERRSETQTRLVSNDGHTRREENRRVRENRFEAGIMDRRMDARSIPTESRDSRNGNPVQQLARGSRSNENVRGADVRARIASNERDSSRVYNRRNAEDRIRDVNHVAIVRSVTRRIDDGRRSDRTAQRSGDDGRASEKRVESRWSKGSQRGVRSLERESSNMKWTILDVRSSRLSRSIDNMRRSGRRGEIDSARRETRRLDDRNNSEIQREMKNMVVNKNFMERRQTEIRRQETEARNIRKTDDIRRSDRTLQLSRGDVRRMENTRSVNDRKGREIGRVDNKLADTRRMYSNDKDARFTSAGVMVMKTSSDENYKISEQIRNARERITRPTDSRRDGRSQRSSDENAAVNKAPTSIIRSDDAVQRTERMARNNRKENYNRRLLKNSNSQTRDVRKTRIIDSREIYHPEIKFERTAKPDSSERRTIFAERVAQKWNAPAHRVEQMYGMTQNMDYYAAVKSVVTNWLATFDSTMIDVSRLGGTVMYGGIVCYALFANVNKKIIF